MATASGFGHKVHDQSGSNSLDIPFFPPIINLLASGIVVFRNVH